MPIYEYLCTACDQRADILHGRNDPGPHFCPSCGSEGTMRKQFGLPSIHFKGSGWAKKDRGAARASSSSKATAGESKPAEGTPAAGKDAAPGTSTSAGTSSTPPGD
jgi:putative FmdB family regulatory protein